MQGYSVAALAAALVGAEKFGLPITVRVGVTIPKACGPTTTYEVRGLVPDIVRALTIKACDSMPDPSSWSVSDCNLHGRETGSFRKHLVPDRFGRHVIGLEPRLSKHIPGPIFGGPDARERILASRRLGHVDVNRVVLTVGGCREGEVQIGSFNECDALPRKPVSAGTELLCLLHKRVAPSAEGIPNKMLIGGESEGWPPRAVSSALRFSKQWKKPVGENTGSCRIGNSDRDLAGGVPGSIRRVICEGAFSKCRICCERRLADIEQQMRAVGYPREHMASVQPQVDGRYVPGSLVPNVKAILASPQTMRSSRRSTASCAASV